ncbi:MAG: sugar phosphate isomerase/epimerase [Candidatus Melainabacteria bacterium]|nr:sugar phosphate isomerase/epimerase [Candidatus Melainabacteria bacterium]
MLASMKGLPAVEFTFAPFVATSREARALGSREKTFLAEVRHLCAESKVEIALMNLDFCLRASEKACVREFLCMIRKLASVAKVASCKRLSFWLEADSGEDFLELAEKVVLNACEECAEKDVVLLLRLSTPSKHKGQSLSFWHSLSPQEWRYLLSSIPQLALSFSPGDCVWQGLNYLQILPAFISAIEHIEVRDVEINHDMLADSGMFGPLWWRYRLAGKGQVDWHQLVEALKLYNWPGTFSLHLDDEFVADRLLELDQSLDASLTYIGELVKG